MLKVGEDQVRRDRGLGWVQRCGRGGTQVELRDGRIEACFQRPVQLRVVASSRVLVRVVVGTLFMTLSVLLMRRFERKMPDPVDADDHAPIQAEATACQDGEADQETGSDAKRHKIGPHPTSQSVRVKVRRARGKIARSLPH